MIVERGVDTIETTSAIHAATLPASFQLIMLLSSFRMDKLSSNESLSIVVELIPARSKFERLWRELRWGGGASQEIVDGAIKIVCNAGKTKGGHSLRIIDLANGINA